MHSQTERPQTQLDAIDSLRGIAALYVLSFHLLYVPTVRVLPPAFTLAFFNAGGTGVTLFFVISAFTLCLSSDSRKSEPKPVFRFYLRRIFRILPLFLVLLVLEIHWFGIPQDNYRLSSRVATIGTNLTFLYNFLPGRQEGIVWASWTLGIEMVFYAFFPLLFRLVNTLSRAMVFLVATLVVALAVGAAVHYRVDFFRFSIFRHLPAFASGFVLFFIFRQYRGVLGRNRASLLIAAACLVHWILFTYPVPDYGQAVAVQSIVWASLTLGLCIFPLPIFVNSVTKFAGEISYSMYLIHPVLLFFMSPVFGRFTSLPNSWPFAVSLIVVTIVVASVASITYRLIERPGMHLGSRTIRKVCV